MPEILPTPDGKEPAGHVDCFFQALASGSLAPQGADDRIKGPVNQRPLLKQGQPAAPHFMSQFGQGGKTPLAHDFQELIPPRLNNHPRSTKMKDIYQFLAYNPLLLLITLQKTTIYPDYSLYFP